jgi:hypothetical protein
MLGNEHGFFSRQLFPLRVAALSFATCIVFFSCKAARASPYICIRALGGLSYDSRPQPALEIVFWALVVVPESWSLSVIARQAVSTQLRLAAAVVILFTSAAVALFTEAFVVWVISLSVSCSACVYVSILIVRALLAARKQSKNYFTRWLTFIAIPAVITAWFAFPVLWFLGQFSVVSAVAELALSTYLGFVTRLMIGSTLMFGSFFKRTRDTEEQIEAFVSRSREADARRILS